MKFAFIVTGPIFLQSYYVLDNVLHIFNPLTSLPKSADTAESQISFAGILS